MKTAKHNPQESTKMQFQLKRAVAAGSERFHDSLDELENEIRMAQAVLRRDLAQLRAERKQKEAQAKEKEAEKDEDKWCALCEKDGHLAFDCPEEQY